MQRLKNHWLFLLACLIVSPHSVAALNIIFVNPGFAEQHTTITDGSGKFWSKVTHIMQAAADDLAINLTTLYADRNHIAMKTLVAQAIKTRPDYLILVDEKQVLSDYLITINTQNIPIYFLLNRPDGLALRKLQQHNVQVVGSVVPGNRDGGKQLANALYQQHKISNREKMNILALLGDYTTPAAIKRRAGLNDFLTLHPDATLIGADVANWSMKQSYKKTLAFLHAAPDINTIWCANDAMAFGAIQALNTLNRKDTTLVGGFNWDNAPFTEMKIDVSMGGHVLLGAYAMLAIYDATQKPLQFPLQHQDFTFFTAQTAENKPLITHINQGQLHQIDFLKFARSQANNLIFNVENLNKALIDKL